MPKVTTEELQAFFSREFPQATVTIEDSGPGFCRVSQEISQEHLRPGNTVSGPVMMWIADCATYGAVLTEVGLVPLAVTTNITMNFLRKPPADGRLVFVKNSGSKLSFRVGRPLRG